MSPSIRKFVWLLLIGVCLVLLNDIASRIPNPQIDFTHENLFTLSASSRQLLAKIKQPIEVELYFSGSRKALPVGLKIFAQRVEQLLRQYERGSNGLLKVRVIDPLDGSAEEQEARRFGLLAQPLGAGEHLYFGLAAIQGSGNQRVIPLIDFRRERLLEYDISQLIYSVQRQKLPKLAVVSSLEVFGKRGMPKRLQKIEDGTAEWQFVKELRTDFDLEEVVPAASTLPADADILLVINPTGFDPRLVHAIDQYVLSGRPAVVLLDPYCYHEAVRQASSGVVLGEQYYLASDLPNLLPHWGVKFSAGEVVGDLAFATDVPLAKDQSTIRFPLWLTLSEFDDGQAITSGFDRLLLAYTGRLVPMGDSRVTFSPLLRSSAQSAPVSVERIGKIDPRRFSQLIRPAGDVSVVAASIEGTFTTGFPSGKPQPPEGQMEAAEKDPWDLGLKQSIKTSRVILVGDADFLDDDLAFELVGKTGGTLITKPRNDNFAFLRRSLVSLEGGLEEANVGPKIAAIRPFVRVHQMRSTMEAAFSRDVEAINVRSDQLAAQLSELNQQATQGGGSMVSAKALTAIRRIEREQGALRSQRVAIEERLQQAIRSMGRWLTFMNFVVVPGVIALAGVLFWFWRTRVRTTP